MKKRRKNNKIKKTKREKSSLPFFPIQIKQKIFGVVMVLLAIIIGMSFFGLSGKAGDIFMNGFNYLIGKAIFAFPFFLILAGLIFWEGVKVFGERWWLAILAILMFMLGLSGILGSLSPSLKLGGEVGYLMASPLLGLFDLWVTLIVFCGLLTIASLIIFYPIYQTREKKEKAVDKEENKEENKEKEKEERVSFIKRELFPKFKVKGVSFQGSRTEEEKKEEPKKPEAVSDLNLKQSSIVSKEEKRYEKPPLDLLAENKKGPEAGDLKANMLIIKRSLQNFNLPVEMGQVNVGPTVTQYTLKPAEGIKVSKITTLSNDLSLALAAHPIRIEAPIPGKSLVGIEVPNTVRAHVRLRDLVQDPVFQNAASPLVFVLGKDVSGNSAYADLARMPHLLVAGSTGSGKTVFLNNLILSFLYKDPPEILKLILIDPKRVEFPVYNGLPHLLAPVICDNNKAVNALRWLIEEMERRFSVLAKAKAKDIVSYNELVTNGEAERLSYIVLIIDELADLMASKGREVETAIVRLAQMARAVGIHLIVATQRPSVEVITGLIKANITSRIAFQVASQVDSRTIFDMSGAEKLLGRGDMLFVSSDIPKPKRIQAALVTEKETKKVVKFIKSKIDPADIEDGSLAESLKEKLEEESSGSFDVFSRGSDPLLETAKKVVVDSGKASASLLQRRLQVGYARAARLMDMLEEKGIVGPSDGAKPRQVFAVSSEEDEVAEMEEIEAMETTEEEEI